MTLVQPTALLGLALAPVAPLPGDRREVRTWLDGWWYAAHAAGMDQGVDQLPALLPERIEEDELSWLTALAGRRAGDGSAGALAFRAHDVVGLLLRWELRDLDLAVATAALPAPDAEPPASALGEVRVVVATAPDPTTLDPAAVLAELGLPGSGLRFDAVLDGQALLAEVETGGRRTLALVVPDDDPGLADRLLAVSTAPAMGALTRYLVHGAKLRYLTGVFQAEQVRVRAAGQRSDDSLADLFRLHETLEGATGRLDRTFFDANSRLGRAQGDAAGLAVMATRLKDLARSAHIAARNIEAYAPASARTTATGTAPNATSFERDAELADWLRESVEQEAGYLSSAKARAAEAHQLTQLRLEQASEEEARLSNRLTTLQTSVLGAVLGFLGVMEAFGESFQGHPRLFWPVFLTVPTLALLVPPLTLRWVTGLTALDVAAGAACGAGTGWTLASIAGAHPFLGAALTGLLGGFGAATVAIHRRRQELGTPAVAT